MGKPKKPEDWRTDEALRKLFPKPVADELKRVARGASPKKKREPKEPPGPSWKPEEPS